MHPRYPWANLETFVRESGITEPVLRDLYARGGDARVAQEWGTEPGVVARLRERWGIKTVTPTERRELLNPDLPKITELTPVQLAKLYTRMGERAIGKIYGVSRAVIRGLLDQWGIPVLTKSDRVAVGVEFTPLMQEVVTGTLLGDAHITPQGRYQLAHTHKQYHYLLHLHTALGGLARPVGYWEQELSSGQVCYAFGFATRPHRALKALRALFYPDGVKVFPDEVLDNLSARSLALWYFDDGTSGGYFALGNISDEAAERVALKVGQRFGLEVRVRDCTRGTSCQQIRVLPDSQDKFYRLIRGFATPDMLYKIPESLWPVGVRPFRSPAALREPKIPDGFGPQVWADTDRRDEVLDQLFQYWRSRGFPFPIARPDEISALRNVEESHVLVQGRVVRSQIGQSTCQAFMPHIWQARSHGDRPSPWALFHDDKELKKVLRWVLDRGDQPNAANIRAGVRYLYQTGVYNFRPAAAKALVDRFGRTGGRVWDPCAGWGGRLLGTLLSGRHMTYRGTDPSTQTIEGLRGITGWLSALVPGAENRVELDCLPVEELDIADSSVDLVLTSPPYWKRELYCEEDTQSSARYPTYGSWLQGFLRPLLARAFRALAPGGWLVLNVDDFNLEGQSYPLIEDTKALAREAGFGPPAEIYQYSLASPHVTDNHEVVLCWPRGAAYLNAPDQARVGLSLCPRCGQPSLGGAYCCEITKPLVKKRCLVCREEFLSPKGRRVCSAKCRSRLGYLQYRLTAPYKTSRDMTCKGCGQGFPAPLGGVYSYCPSCSEKRDLAAARQQDADREKRKAKTCQYRHCGKAFRDHHPRNTSKFCSPECRRREKMFRTGVVTSESEFRQPATGLRSCLVCRNPHPSPTLTRCPDCIEKARHKVCRCGNPYRDDSMKNTRRYCFTCRPAV